MWNWPFIDEIFQKNYKTWNPKIVLQILYIGWKSDFSLIERKCFWSLTTTRWCKENCPNLRKPTKVRKIFRRNSILDRSSCSPDTKFYWRRCRCRPVTTSSETSSGSARTALLKEKNKVLKEFFGRQYGDNTTLIRKRRAKIVLKIAIAGNNSYQTK